MTLDVYLSPHFDDAVLSCGGSIARASEDRADSLVVTVFGGQIPDGFVPGPAAAWLHAACGNVADLVAERRREDAEALELLGASGSFLTHPDAVYRPAPDGRPAHGPDLWRALTPDDQALVDAIVREVGSLPEDITLHGPLAVGGHIDHRIVRAATDSLARQRGADALYYEDMPHTARAATREIGAATIGLTSVTHLLSDGQLSSKVAAVAAYATQVRMLWRSTTAMQRELRWYARGLVPVGAAEREWVADR